jgi:putative sporulation protein YyaC
MYNSLLHWFKPAVPTESRINIQDAHAVENFAESFRQLLDSLRGHPTQPVVILCIGTDRSTGDALGPLIGSRLQEVGFNHAPVFGNLDTPVHATNLATFIDIIKAQHVNSLIVAIDACLGRTDSVGHITLAKGSIKPGAGVNKALPEVGDIAITGIVNVGGFMENLVLQNTRLNLVMNMAHTIAAGINRGFTIRY